MVSSHIKYVPIASQKPKGRRACFPLWACSMSLWADTSGRCSFGISFPFVVTSFAHFLVFRLFIFVFFIFGNPLPQGNGFRALTRKC